MQPCGGSVSVRGAIHSRVFVQGSKPKSKLAEKVPLHVYVSITGLNHTIRGTRPLLCEQLLKRDVISTVAARVFMLVEELLTAEVDHRKDKQGTHTCSLSVCICICHYKECLFLNLVFSSLGCVFIFLWCMATHLVVIPKGSDTSCSFGRIWLNIPLFIPL